MKTLFQIFEAYLDDENITDINYNGKTLWVDHLKKGRYQIEDFEDDGIEQFCFQIANQLNLPFNVTHPLLEAESDQMRISILHPSIAKSGFSISIRKTPAIMRLKRSILIKEKYASATLLDFLKLAVEKQCNIMVAGLPGAGKTELVKYLASFIPNNKRIITIEDTLELRHHVIHPESDCVAIKVKEQFTYSDAIKASLRQKPDWILVSEIRSREVTYLLEAVSTGAHLLSTIHCASAQAIPKRMLAMFQESQLNENAVLENIHEAIDIGIYLRSDITSTGITRMIDHVVIFESDPHPHYICIYQDQKLDLETLSERLRTRLYPLKERRKKNGI